MRRILSVASCLFLAASVTGAQSLGEIAKREKERRKSVQKAGASKVITEEDLDDGKADEAPADPEPGASNDGESGGRPYIPDVVSPTPDRPASNGSAPVDEWPEVFAKFQKAYREAKTGLDFFRKFQRHCEDGTPPPPLPPVPGGGFWMVNCDNVPQDVARFEKTLKDIENDCYNTARRMRIPPGRARLR